MREILNPKTMGDLITEQAAREPDRIGLIFEGETFTYAQMEERSNKAAALFQSLDVHRGDRIAWIAQNLAVFWDALFGAAKIGAVLTPINWRLAPTEISQILDDSGADILVAEQGFLDSLQAVGVKLPAYVMVLGTGAGSFEDRLETANGDKQQSGVESDDIFVQLYTSGTTGLPKGVMLSHRAYHEFANASSPLGIVNPKSDDEVALHALPHFHVAGINFGLMAIARTMPILQLRQFDPAAIVTAAQGDKPLNSFFVPAMIMMILEAAKQMQVPLTKFANMSYGAAPMPEPLLDVAMTAMPNASFTQVYGATENCGAVTYLDHENHRPGLKQRVSAGKPWPRTSLKVCDPETGESLAQGKTGEIWMQSGAVMDGYWRRDDASSEVLVDGWYKTGDAGFLDENGFLYVCDRIKDMIISGGENIYPAELENIMADHPAVMESAVIGVPDDKWGEIVKVFVVRRAGADLSADNVTDFLADKIAKFKLPRQVEFLDALPRNASGKILKTELRKM